MHVLTAEHIDEYDEPEPIYCPFCLERGYQIHLGPKILMPGEPRPEDYENFLECATCGFLCPIYQVEKEATIRNAVETIDNPFESKTIIESLPRRNFHKTGKKLNPRSKRKKRMLHDDPEVDALMRIYGDRVNVVMDSDP